MCSPWLSGQDSAHDGEEGLVPLDSPEHTADNGGLEQVLTLG